MGGLAGVVFFSCAAIAQTESLAIGPDDSVRLGLARSPAVEVSGAELAAAVALQDQARGALLPSLEIQANYFYLGGDIGDVEFNVPGMDLSLEAWPTVRHRVHSEAHLQQPIFRGNQLRNELNAARLETDAAAAFLAQAEADQAYLIREAWWELYRARALLRASEAAREHIEAHLDEVQRQLDEGAALVRDLLTARTRRAEVRLEQVEARHAVELWRRELARQLGLPSQTEVLTVAEIEVALPEEGLDAWALQADLRRPEVLGLTLQAEARRREVAAQRGRLAPELSAFARGVLARPNSYFFNAQEAFRSHYEVGLRLNWRLFEGGAGRARVREAQARHLGAQARVREAREALGGEATRQYLELERTVHAYNLGRIAVIEAREVLRVTRLQYAEGLALNAEVLDAERALWQAEATLANALADHALARAALLRVRGGVW